MSHLYREYKPAVEVRSARVLDEQPSFIKRKKLGGKYAVGVRYEREVQEYLSTLALGRPEIEYLPSPWIEFIDRSGRRWCQPDALLVRRDERVVICVEVKYQHCQEAWFQLEELYRPVVRCLFAGFGIGLVEIVHWHDPQVGFPRRYDFTDSPFIVRHANLVSVHIYNAKRERAQAGGYSSSKSASKAADICWTEEGAARFSTFTGQCGRGLVGSRGD